MEAEARERVIVEVSFDHQRGQYVASHSALRSPVTAFSLTHLRKRIEDQLKDEGGTDIRLVLDKQARQRNHRRSRGGWGGAEQWW